MKKWFAYLVLLSGIYDLLLAVLFLLASPIVSIVIAYPLTPLSGALLQISGAFLLAFGLALIVASHNLDQLLIIPFVNSIVRLLFFVILLYYIIVWSLPFSLLPLGIIDAVLGLLFLLFIFAIEDYSVRSILTSPRT